ncbi:hypothetical protein [Lysinibacillus sphaericus]|uniref:TP901 family phage tail tape measure protein n=1 Tax=Lysinibacillus sphaericus OT4b.31 TaxID=1285586 RepID=R7ZJ57_LYSSH|nr:hypothetical protein [Lysinibacillus sphaericus]EON74130.1 TP901 family phage tail tape measure protein [Lysinibacillus sphaericus OT4b.31]
MRQLTQMMERMNRTSRAAGESVSRSQTAVNRFGSAVSSTSNRMSGFSTRMTGLRAGTNGLSASFSGMQSALVGIASAYLGAQGAAKAFDATIGAAARYQQSEVAVKAIFNDDKKSNAYMKMVDKMAIDSPLLNSTDMLASSKSLVSMTKNVDDLGKAWSIIERLMVLDPTQGTDGAAFSLKELWQGDSQSMVERFGLDRQKLNDIKKMAIPQQIAEINKMLDGMGITQKTVDAMGKTTLGYWAQIGERVGKFMRQIGNMGNSKLGASLGGIVKMFDNSESALNSLAAKLDAKLASIVDKAISFGKFVWKWREPIAYTIGALAAALGAFAVVGVIAALANPISLIAAGIASAVVGFKALYDNSKLVRGVIDGIGTAFDAISKIFNGEHRAAIDLLESTGLNPKQVDLIRKFGYSLKEAVGNIKGTFQSISHIFNGQHKAAIDVLKSAGFSTEQANQVRKFGYRLKSAFDVVREVLNGVGTLLTGGGSTDLAAALGMSPETATKVDGFIKNVYDNIVSFVNFTKTKFEEFKTYISEKITQIQPVFERLKEAFSQAFTTIGSIISNAWSIIEPYLSGFWNLLQILGDIAVIVFNNVIAPSISFTTQLFSTLWTIAQPILSALAVGFELLSEVIKWLWDNVLAPLVEFILTGVKNAFDTFSEVLSAVQGWFETLSGWISTAYGHVKDFASFISSVKMPDWITNGISAGVNFVGGLIGAGDKGGKKSHYSGLDSVPYDGYSARLHKGERVLTSRENKEYSQGNGGSSNGAITIAKLADSIIVREDADIDRIADGLVTKILERRGVTA